MVQLTHDRASARLSISATSTLPVCKSNKCNFQKVKNPLENLQTPKHSKELTVLYPTFQGLLILFLTSNEVWLKLTTRHAVVVRSISKFFSSYLKGWQSGSQYRSKRKPLKMTLPGGGTLAGINESMVGDASSRCGH